MNHRALLTIAPAALALALVSTPAALAAPAAPTTSSVRAATGQCSETYVPLGHYATFRTWFFGRTIVRLRTSGPTQSAYVQWWSGPTSVEQDLGPGASIDLNRSFAGLGITFHPWYTNGVYVSFPYGPC